MNRSSLLSVDSFDQNDGRRRRDGMRPFDIEGLLDLPVAVDVPGARWIRPGSGSDWSDPFTLVKLKVGREIRNAEL